MKVISSKFSFFKKKIASWTIKQKSWKRFFHHFFPKSPHILSNMTDFLKNIFLCQNLGFLKKNENVLSFDRILQLLQTIFRSNHNFLMFFPNLEGRKLPGVSRTSCLMTCMFRNATYGSPVVAAESTSSLDIAGSTSLNGLSRKVSGEKKRDVASEEFERRDAPELSSDHTQKLNKLVTTVKAKLAKKEKASNAWRPSVHMS